MFLTTLLMNLLSLQMCFDRQNFLPNIFSITANLLLYIAAIITMLKKLRSFHKRNQGKEKEKETDLSLPHWGKISSSSGLPDS
jgi:hypothetical protein